MAKLVQASAYQHYVVSYDDATAFAEDLPRWMNCGFGFRLVDSSLAAEGRKGKTLEISYSRQLSDDRWPTKELANAHGGRS